MDNDNNYFDEMYGGGGQRREPYADYHDWIETEDLARLKKQSAESEVFFRRTGITFNVYGEEEASERLIPFDIVPRIISSREWSRLARGIEQRVRAINAFLYDIYHRQEIIRAGRVPVELIAENEAFQPEMIGVSPPGNVYTHIVGVDIVRTGENDFFVLENNARTPSGVSYMLENRETMLKMFPELFTRVRVRNISSYPKDLRASLAASAPRACNGKPIVAILTPGIHKSAYFEHAFLADQMGSKKRSLKSSRPGAVPSPTLWSMSPIISTNSWSRKSTDRAATACWSGRRQAKRSWRVSRPSSWRTRALCPAAASTDAEIEGGPRGDRVGHLDRRRQARAGLR